MKTDTPPAILVVDDEPVVANTLRLLIEQATAKRVLTCHSAEAAVKLLHDQLDIALLLCDMELPGASGTTVFKTARRLNPNIVSILITGKADKDDIVEALNTGGIWKFVSKPWRQADLAALVVEGLKKNADNLEQQRLLRHLALNVRRSDNAGATDPDAGGAPPVLPWMDRRYRLETLLREGGNSAIYRAEDTLLRMPVAIKVLLEAFTMDPGSLGLLFDEARIAMRLSHRHIVRLHTLQEAQGRYFLVMEYIDGVTLRDILAKHGRLPANTVLQIMSVCADAIGYAHRRHVYHRDLKPDNLMLANDGTLKIIDFGLACLAGQRRENDLICGTPCYMSPEEYEGTPLDQRSDIFSMAVTVHELLTGRLPAPKGLPPPDMKGYLPPVLSGDLVPPVRQVMEKGLAMDPDSRWPDMASFEDALRTAFRESPAI